MSGRKKWSTNTKVNMGRGPARPNCLQALIGCYLEATVLANRENKMRTTLSSYLVHWIVPKIEVVVLMTRAARLLVWKAAVPLLMFVDLTWACIHDVDRLGLLGKVLLTWKKWIMAEALALPAAQVMCQPVRPCWCSHTSPGCTHWHAMWSHWRRGRKWVNRWRNGGGMHPYQFHSKCCSTCQQVVQHLCCSWTWPSCLHVIWPCRGGGGEWLQWAWSEGKGWHNLSHALPCQWLWRMTQACWQVPILRMQMCHPILSFFQEQPQI